MAKKIASLVWHLGGIQENVFLLLITCIMVNIEDLTSGPSRTFDKGWFLALAKNLYSCLASGGIQENVFLLLTCIMVNMKTDIWPKQNFRQGWLAHWQKKLHLCVWHLGGFKKMFSLLLPASW
ncbi:hypothetical protein AVEN_96997-1 [Araneus ventricosus]|uniref:Uncharacterized protein n=1 Tax=Araneus ventricosus TaxID=182803 RepID=A0A4Y2FQM4_ARAVE|nr:hypothetical protein AVEN_96997-1 [Araneus ventricosus]